MNESVFRELLEKSFRREYAEFDDAPEHKFSLRHKLAMKRIFARYDKNLYKLKKAEGAFAPLRSESMPHYGIKQRLIFALVIVLLLTLLAGWFIPLHAITEAQIDWLRSRYDFPSMKMKTAQTLDLGENAEFAMITVTETEEYKSFLADLVDMEIYSAKEVETLKTKALPTDTRLDPDNLEHRAYKSSDDESPLNSYRDFVAFLEERIEFYNKRAKDPLQAVDGDAEFAEEIARDYLPLPRSFLELLEKLFADVPDDESDSWNEGLLDLDKDDRVYLCEINKV